MDLYMKSKDMITKGVAERQAADAKFEADANAETRAAVEE